MNSIVTNTKILVAAVLTTFIAAGCSISDSNNNAPKPVNVNMQVATAGSAPVAPKATSSHVTLSSVKMLVEELELESVEEDSLDFEIENQVIQLPLDGSPYQLAAADIAPGMYDEFEMEIEGLDDDDNVNDPDFTEGSEETSIIIEGSYNGEDFSFQSEEDFEIEFEFNPPIQIDENTTNVDINLIVDINSWFLDEAGNDLDPTDPDNKEQIEENIEKSFKAEKDEDDLDDEEDDDDDGDGDDD